MEKIKISVRLTVSEDERNLTITPDDMGFTELEWFNLSDSEKEVEIDKYVDSLPEQPYFVVSKWTER